MEVLMYFGEISNTGGPSDIHNKKIDAVSQETQKVKPDADKSLPEKQLSDSTNISVDASEIARYQELVAIHREAYGETDRSEKLKAVRERIESGYYDDPEVMDRISDRVVEETSADRVKAKDLDQIKQRKANGFYDQPKVIDKTAENVVNSIMPEKK